jgi:hypothetical protein
LLSRLQAGQQVLDLDVHQWIARGDFTLETAPWLHLRPSGPHGRITAGEAADIDVIITISWGWSRSNPGHPRSLELSDEISTAAKAALMHFAQAAE